MEIVEKFTTQMSFCHTSIFTTDCFVQSQKSDVNLEIVEFLQKFFVLSDVFQFGSDFL